MGWRNCYFVDLHMLRRAGGVDYNIGDVFRVQSPNSGIHIRRFLLIPVKTDLY